MNDYREISRRIKKEDPQYSDGARIMDGLASVLKKRGLLPQKLGAPQPKQTEKEIFNPSTADMTEIPGFMRTRGEEELREPYNRFSQEAVNTMKHAVVASAKLNHNYLGSEHLLAGLAETEGSIAQQVLASFGIEGHTVNKNAEFIIGRGNNPQSDAPGLSPRSIKIVQLAVDEARRFNSDNVGTEHLLLGMLREGEGIAMGILENHGVSTDRLRAATVMVMSNKPQ